MIRTMQAKDIEQVLEIERESFKSPWPRSAFLQLLNFNDAISIVYEKNNSKIIGYGMAIIDKSCPSLTDVDKPDKSGLHIINLAVAPKERRKGIGSNILNELIKYSEQNHSARVVLEVRTHNKPAINFYKKHRFRKVGVKYKYYPDGEDAIIMEKKLNG